MADNTTGLKNLKKAQRVVREYAIRDKFVAMRADMAKGLIEREGEIDLVLTALLCKEHPLLVGPPGTAKSLLLDTLASWMPEAKKFEILYSKATTPDEVFGPLNLKKFKEGLYERVGTGMLQEAHFGFGDEIFKANSFILNTKLKALNERKYPDGRGGWLKIPLIQFVAASNEWPNDQDGGKELGALFDRFLFRKTVKVVSKANRRRLLWGDLRQDLSTEITPEEIEEAAADVRRVPWLPESEEAMLKIITLLNQEGVYPGDRRMRKSVQAAQGFAYLNGADKVDVEHLEILAHVLWDDPTEQPKKCADVVLKVANPTNMIITEKLQQVNEVITKTTNPYDAIAQLQAISDELDKLPDSQRRKIAYRRISEEIGVLNKKVLRIKD